MKKCDLKSIDRFFLRLQDKANFEKYRFIDRSWMDCIIIQILKTKYKYILFKYLLYYVRGSW